MFCGQPYYFDELLHRQPMSKDQFRGLPLHKKQQLREAWDIRAELIRASKKNPPLGSGGNS
jgi:hypothetical protein